MPAPDPAVRQQFVAQAQGHVGEVIAQSINSAAATNAEAAAAGAVDPRAKEGIWDGLGQVAVNAVLTVLARELQTDVIPAMQGAVDILEKHHPGSHFVDGLQKGIDLLSSEFPSPKIVTEPGSPAPPQNPPRTGGTTTAE